MSSENNISPRAAWRRALLIGRRQPWLTGWGPWLIIGLFSYWYWQLAWLNLWQLRAGLDLGTYTQILSNLTAGQWPPFNSLKGQIAWGDHAHLIMILLAPLFKLWPRPGLLLIIQVMAVTLSGWAAFRLARAAVKQTIFAYAVLVAYLTFFGVQYALDFDWHANVLTAGLLIWSFYALHFGRWRLYWLTMGLNFLTREDAATFYLMLGGYLLLNRLVGLSGGRLRWRWGARQTHGLATLIASGGYFLWVGYWLMPRWRTDGLALAYLDWADQSKQPLAIVWWLISHPLTIAQNMLDTPTKVKTIRHLFQSWGFWPLGHPLTYLVATPNLLARFLSHEDNRYLMRLHYSVSLLPVLTYGTILTVAAVINLAERLVKPRARSAVRVTAASLATLILLIGTYNSSIRDPNLPLRRLATEDWHQRDQWRDRRAWLTKWADTIPPTESVAAASGVVPILAARFRIYNFPQPESESPDWVVLTDRGNVWPLRRGEMNRYLRQYQHRSDYRLVDSRQGVYIFRRR